MHGAVNRVDAVEVRARRLDRGDLAIGELAREVGGGQTDEVVAVASLLLPQDRGHHEPVAVALGRAGRAPARRSARFADDVVTEDVLHRDRVARRRHVGRRDPAHLLDGLHDLAEFGRGARSLPR